MRALSKPKPPKELIPGHGGRLSFVDEGAIFFIPRSFLESWPALKVKVSKAGDKITIERAEEE